MAGNQLRRVSPMSASVLHCCGCLEPTLSASQSPSRRRSAAIGSREVSSPLAALILATFLLLLMVTTGTSTPVTRTSTSNSDLGQFSGLLDRISDSGGSIPRRHPSPFAPSILRNSGFRVSDPNDILDKFRQSDQTPPTLADDDVARLRDAHLPENSTTPQQPGVSSHQPRSDNASSSGHHHHHTRAQWKQLEMCRIRKGLFEIKRDGCKSKKVRLNKCHGSCFTRDKLELKNNKIHFLLRHRCCSADHTEEVVVKLQCNSGEPIQRVKVASATSCRCMYKHRHVSVLFTL